MQTQRIYYTRMVDSHLIRACIQFVRAEMMNLNWYEAETKKSLIKSKTKKATYKFKFYIQWQFAYMPYKHTMPYAHSTQHTIDVRVWFFLESYCCRKRTLINISAITSPSTNNTRTFKWDKSIKCFSLFRLIVWPAEWRYVKDGIDIVAHRHHYDDGECEQNMNKIGRLPQSAKWNGRQTVATSTTILNFSIEFIYISFFFYFGHSFISVCCLVIGRRRIESFIFLLCK